VHRYGRAVPCELQGWLQIERSTEWRRDRLSWRPLSLQTLPCTPQRNRLAPALLYEPPFLLLTGSLAGALPAIRAAEGGARRTGKAIASRIGLPVAAGLDETAMCRADAANKHFVEEAANY
jgi:hypothetical protein